MKTKIIAILIALVVLVGIGSAALVGYLSNTVEADITVESPMIVGISLGDGTWGEASYPEGSHNLADWEMTEIPLIILDSEENPVNGGETITLYTLSENLANVEITGFEEAIVTNTLGVTCNDFESVIVRVDSIYGDSGYGTPQQLITDGCQEIKWNTIQFGSPDDSTWGAGEADVSEIVVTFRTDAKGTYIFTYRVIPS